MARNHVGLRAELAACVRPWADWLSRMGPIAIKVALGLILFLVLGLCNPMLLAFLTEIRVENNSGERLFVTYVGNCESGGKRTLPRFLNRFPPAIPLLGQRIDEPVGAGEAQKVIYDWDDVNFNWIVVRGERGSYRMMETPLASKTGCCWSSPLTTYRIPRLADLPEAPADLLRQAGINPINVR